jgi:sugar O-acyltransferase (sialic acid O-acetyltransferase NeuD family)
MIIVGAKGHAQDIISDSSFYNLAGTHFMFDNVSRGMPDILFNKYILLRSLKEAKEKAAKHSFILAIGSPLGREKIYSLFIENGFDPANFISTSALVSEQAIIGKGLNIMPFSSIFAGSKVGDGCLINSYSSIHHDVVVGDFVTVSPGARLLGRVKIGNATEIGANAVVLPDVTIGERVVIGSGAVVTKDLPDDVTAIGIPARVIRS